MGEEQIEVLKKEWEAVKDAVLPDDEDEDFKWSSLNINFKYGFPLWNHNFSMINKVIPKYETLPIMEDSEISELQ